MQELEATIAKDEEDARATDQEIADLKAALEKAEAEAQEQHVGLAQAQRELSQVLIPASCLRVAVGVWQGTFHGPSLRPCHSLPFTNCPSRQKHFVTDSTRSKPSAPTAFLTPTDAPALAVPPWGGPPHALIRTSTRQGGP